MIRRFFANLRQEGHGFSIIEMTIVLLIIGVLVGITLKGQDVLQDARIKAMRQQVEGFRVQLSSFKDRYQALPGDFRSASKRIESRNDITVGNGNGNNRIDSPKEQFLFWQHMALSGIISGILIEEDPTLIYGETAPSARVGGGFLPIFTRVYGRTPRHWFRLSESTETKGDDDFSGVLTAVQAFSTDKAMDDGSPKTGKIVATGDGCLDGKEYTVNDSDKTCVLYFAF